MSGEMENMRKRINGLVKEL